MELDIEALIESARRRLPASHRALLEQLGVQDAVIHEWPRSAQDPTRRCAKRHHDLGI